MLRVAVCHVPLRASLLPVVAGALVLGACRGSPVPEGATPVELPALAAAPPGARGASFPAARGAATGKTAGPKPLFGAPPEEPADGEPDPAEQGDDAGTEAPSPVIPTPTPKHGTPL